MTREEQKVQRKERILEAALEVFVRKGFHGAKISDIAKEAGMSAGLLFHYFKNKEEAYEELIRTGLRGPASVMDVPTEEPAQFFHTAASLILAELDKNGFTAKMFAFMIQASISPATEKARELLVSLNTIDASVPYVEAGQKMGLFKEGNAQALSLSFWSAINGIALIKVISPHFALPESGWLLDILRKHEPL